MPSLTTDATAALPTNEEELRGHLAKVLDQARACLLSYGVLDPETAVLEDPGSVTTLLGVLSALLAEAIQLNGALREVEDLSLDGALVAGAVTVAVSALVDTIALLTASRDAAISA